MKRGHQPHGGRSDDHFDKEAALAGMQGRFSDFYSQWTVLKPRAGELRGACPIHGGDGPNFAVDAGTGVWFCHSACQEGGDVFDFLMRREALTFPDALAAVAEFAGVVGMKQPTARPATPRRIAATYAYTDEQGVLLYQAVRYEPKGFSQRRPADGGTWTQSLGDVRRVLYRLPEVLATVHAARAVYICEGEKDADALATLGLCATTAPMGARKWEEGYTESLCGAGVIILPDNDRDGREHGQIVAKALYGRVKRVRVVELPGLPEKGDVSDWLAAGGTKEDLLPLVKATQDWAPAAEFSMSAPSAAGDCPDGEWLDPTPFADADLPPFPTEALPTALAAMVGDVARCVQVPIDQVAVLALSALAAASAHCCRVEIMPEYCEPLNLYVACIAEPGERKTHTLNPLKAPLEAAERGRVEAARADIAQAEGQFAIEEKRLTHLRELAAKAKTSAEREAARSEAGDVAANRTQVPPKPRLLVGGDVTPEQLVMMLAEQKGRLALFDDEGGIFGILAGRYSDGNANLDAILKAHTGGQIRVDRRSHEPIYVARACLTIGLAVQPDVLTSLSDTPAFRGRGLLGRFLYVLPRSMAGRRTMDYRPPDRSARAGYDALIRRLLALPQSDPEQAGPVLSLSPEAFAVHKKFSDLVDRRQSEGRDLAGIRDWGSKLAGQVARIAGAFHLAEHISQPRPWDVRLGEETMLAAWAVGEFLIPHALAAYGQLREDPARRLARRVLGWIGRAQVQTFSLRLCQRALTGGAGVTADETQAALSELSERGYIALQEPLPRIGAGRKPSPIYRVNPALVPDRPQEAHGGEHSDNSDEMDLN
jgi:putative DNA primase/helicase